MWVEGESGIGERALPNAGLANARMASAASQAYIGLADEFSGRFPLGVLLEESLVKTRSTDPDRDQAAVLLCDAAFTDVPSQPAMSAAKVAPSARRRPGVRRTWVAAP